MTGIGALRAMQYGRIQKRVGVISTARGTYHLYECPCESDPPCVAIMVRVGSEVLQQVATRVGWWWYHDSCAERLLDEIDEIERMATSEEWHTPERRAEIQAMEVMAYANDGGIA